MLRGTHSVVLWVCWRMQRVGCGAESCHMVRLGLRSAVCEEGYYKDNQGACQKCDTSCATCNGIGQNACTSCPEEKYLKTNQCIDKTGCTNDHYPDQLSRKCISCGAAVDKGGIADCTACKYNATVSKPQCTACNSSKKVKTALDGTTTCVDLTSQDDCTDANHFKADDNSACYLCSGTSGDNPTTNKGIAQCKACTKQKGATPECSACLDGYIIKGSGNTATCEACGANCATCSAPTDANKCSICMAGFFLVGEADNGHASRAATLLRAASTGVSSAQAPLDPSSAPSARLIENLLALRALK